MSNPVHDDKIDRLQEALGDTYTIRNRIGGGGMGDVYLATHKTLGDKRAIKLLADDLAKDPILVERFINEAKIEANLQHPNIVKVFDIGQKERFYYLVMSFVEGEDLDDRLRRDKRAGIRMDVREAVSIGLQVVKALECAHGANIIHRDLKPSNIRIDQYGTVIVMDFGIARVRQTGMQGKTVLGERLGTPLYMSPEQAAGRPVDARSDLYSLGVILYEMLTGGNPFEAENPLAICMKHLQYEPPDVIDVRPEVPEEISLIVKKLLQKNPDDRYQDATEIRQDLSAGGPGIGVRTPRPTVAVPAHLLQLGPLSALLNRIPDAQTERPLTEAETYLLGLIDGTKTIREILRQSTLSEKETAEAITALQAEGAIYSEIPLGGDEEEEFGTTKISGDTTSRSASPFIPTITPARTTPAARPPVATQAAPAEKKFPVWIAAAAAAVIAVVAGAYFLVRSPSVKLSEVRVDASPFATVTIVSEKGGKILTDDTPFTVSLAPGSYTFEFASAGQTPQKLTRKVGPEISDTVRVEFWAPDETKKLLENYIQ